MNQARIARIILPLCFLPALAEAIVTADGFELPNPNANSGAPPPTIVNAQLSGLGAASVYGSFDAPNVGFAGWEKWSSPVFSLEPPQYRGNSGVLTATLDQDAVGPGRSTTGSNPGLITVDGLEYSGRLTNGPYEFTIEATSTIFLSSVTLHIKHSPFQVDGNTVTAFVASLNTGSLSGIASEPAIKGANLGNSSDAIGLSTTYNMYTYTWNNLSIDPNEPFTVEFFSGADGTGQGFSIDTIAIAVSSVPEPSSCALLALSGAVVGLRRWRRMVAGSNC
jgi:hypothetical protein